MMSESLVTLVFTDLVSSTAMKNQLPSRDQSTRDRLYLHQILTPHREKVETILSNYRGRTIKTMGDAYFIVFDDVLNAAQWAIATQLSHITEPIPTPLGTLQLKIGMHIGNPIPDGNDFIGQDVDCASRLVDLARGGHIVVSATVASLVQHHLQVHLHGDRHLQGIGTIPVYELLYADKQPHPLKAAIAWRQSCQTVLSDKRQLSSAPLMASAGITLSLDDIYVPLGLVERRQVDQLRDVTPDQGSQLYGTTDPPDETIDPYAEGNDYRVIQTFQSDQFFEQVLRQGQSQQSAGRRIAIIGEPGAGKTTLLQKIGDWVWHHTDDLPIWISLADLQGKSLERYLLDDWLKLATRKLHITPEMETAFVEQFSQERVWLLLDAADEMTWRQPGNQDPQPMIHNPLQDIASQLRGWLGQARVVLTCRINVWDAGKNQLSGFDVYRNLNFTPEQAAQFIKAWFSRQDQDTSGTIAAQRLQLELNKTGRERIWDAVRNPFRLSLLCSIWQQRQGRLPKTRAGLYQQFVDALYEWKQEIFPTTSDQRQQLNRALGELALRAIDQPNARFRLNHPLVCEVLGDPDAPLFQLAIRLGWLNQVGVAAEDPSQRVYAFYHPTFQEYFAAQLVDNWRFFLDHRFQDDDLQTAYIAVPRSRPAPESQSVVPRSRPAPTPQSFIPLHPTATYRVFAPQWREVILLWLGRPTIASPDKEALIQALIEFDDRCQSLNLYHHRAFLLAVAGVAEFGECSQTNTIIHQAIQWGFGTQQPAIVNTPLGIAARTALAETRRDRALWYLKQLLTASHDETVRCLIAECLRDIDPSNPQVRAVLTDLVHTCQDPDDRFRAATLLGKLDPGNPLAIAALIRLLERPGQGSRLTLADLIQSLGEIGGTHPLAAKRLLVLLANNQPEAVDSLVKLGAMNPAVVPGLLTAFPTNPLAVDALQRVGIDNPEAIAGLITIIQTHASEATCLLAAETLWHVDAGNPIALEALTTLAQSSQTATLRCHAAESLGRFAPGNSVAIDVLLEHLQTASNAPQRQQILEHIGKIGHGDRRAIETLYRLCQAAPDRDTYWTIVRTLGTIWRSPTAPIIPWLLEMMQDDGASLNQRDATLTLLAIAAEDPTARQWLPDLLHHAPEPLLRWQAAIQLADLGDHSPSVITYLLEAWTMGTYLEIQIQAVQCLGQVGRDDPRVLAALTTILTSSTEPALQQAAIASLVAIGEGSSAVVQALLDALYTTRDKSIHYAVTESLKTLLNGTLLVETVTNIRPAFQNPHLFRRCADLLWHCAQVMGYPEFYRAWHDRG